VYPGLKKKRGSSDSEVWLAAGIAAGMVMCCALLAVMANAYRRQVKKERKIEEAAAELVAKQCDEANKRIRDFQAPFACIKASDFVELGRFVQYEKLRRRNLLTYVDSVRDDFFQATSVVSKSTRPARSSSSGRTGPSGTGGQRRVTRSLRDFGATRPSSATTRAWADAAFTLAAATGAAPARASSRNCSGPTSGLLYNVCGM
jgi:hypothetical protein